MAGLSSGVEAMSSAATGGRFVKPVGVIGGLEKLVKPVVELIPPFKPFRSWFSELGCVDEAMTYRKYELVVTPDTPTVCSALTTSAKGTK